MNKNCRKRVILSILIVIGIVALFVLGLRVVNPFSSTFDSYTSKIPNTVPTGALSEQMEIEVVAENLEIPWALVFLPNEELLVTERSGYISHITSEGIASRIFDLSAEIVNQGESGLLSMIKDPAFEENQFIYIYRSYKNLDNETRVRVDRYRYEAMNFYDKETIIEDIPAGSYHSSGEMAFGPDGFLYITTGDAAEKELAQDGLSLAGKTLRLNSDGSIPENNPFVEDASIRNEIWTLGHRNAQGIDWHPSTGQMFQSEHGPSGFDGGSGRDEINLIQNGKNYGWPDITGLEEKEGMESPLIEFTPAIAPGSIAFYDGDMFPEYQNKLLLAALRGQTVLIVDITDEGGFNPTAAISEILIDDSYGRIREIQIADDGSIYFTTSNRDGRGDIRQGDDKIYRIYR
ncbi:PQQ-dependent sugar dehydrogenase [Candidatus Dojkabacteria bacterium]|uniref:PQQ-dependent sugar dehydrogenase n=1 Tax=Candidatus Dojkabacteria bacterium TaxID=2099670 RepID=A0A955L7Y6_9BACT|nr:PQQ-dependent sugar dehydrogenase [Candidatus Dojkabacteria bacterium]